MPEHGTRTMYVHYGCRCEACCRAEHEQYLKRKEAQARRRVHSKWSLDDEVSDSVTRKKESQRRSDARRWEEFSSRKRLHTRPIKWPEIADAFDMRCAICGCKVDPNDTWETGNGAKCYGRKYPTVDHIIPLRYGGADVLDNVQLTCKHCNSVKGAKVDGAIG